MTGARAIARLLASAAAWPTLVALGVGWLYLLSSLDDRSVALGGVLVLRSAGHEDSVSLAVAVAVWCVCGAIWGALSGVQWSPRGVFVRGLAMGLGVFVLQGVSWEIVRQTHVGFDPGNALRSLAWEVAAVATITGDVAVAVLTGSAYRLDEDARPPSRWGQSAPVALTVLVIGTLALPMHGHRRAPEVIGQVAAAESTATSAGTANFTATVGQPVSLGSTTYDVLETHEHLHAFRGLHYVDRVHLFIHLQITNEGSRTAELTQPLVSLTTASGSIGPTSHVRVPDPVMLQPIPAGGSTDGTVVFDLPREQLASAALTLRGLDRAGTATVRLGLAIPAPCGAPEAKTAKEIARLDQIMRPGVPLRSCKRELD